MQKTLDILEKNVQWIVLGLAALFLLWVAYGYVLTPPATVKIGKVVATPADAALETQKAAKELDRQIKEAKSVSFPTADLVTAWRDHMMNPYIVALRDSDPWNSQPEMENGPQGPEVGPAGMPYIAVLPTLPPAQLLPPVAGLSSVVVQLPNGAQQNPNPVQPVAQPQQKDTDWITLSAIIPAATLKQALLAPFNGAPVNPAMNAVYNTTILEVVLERQQSNGVDANGAPTFPAGNPDKVQALSVYQSILPPIPGDSTLMDTRYQYLTWAQQNQALLTNPMFYQVTAGDIWTAPIPPASTPDSTTPGAPPAAGQPVPSTGQPAVPAPAIPPPVTPATPAPATPTPAPAAPAPHAAGMKLPADAYYGPHDSYRPPGIGFPPGPMNPGAFNPMPAGNGNVPAGVLDPFNLTTDVLIWATDETAKPGVTYHYRLTYRIKNPVFGVLNLAPKKMVNQFVIDSPASAWSPPVIAPPVTKFWVASVTGEHAKLDVFRYANGVWKPTKGMPVNPGDEVPGTDLTLVDVRTSEKKEKYLLLTTDTGDMLRRDANTDKDDPDHQAMLAPPNPNGGTAPPVPNTPPPGARPSGRPGRPMPGHQAAAR